MLLAIFSLLSACSNNDDDVLAELPDDARNVFYNFIEAFESSNQDAVIYMYFPEGNEWDQEAFLANEHNITSYSLLDSEEINANLYAITLEVATTAQDTSKVTWYVGQINNQYWVMDNARNIPADIRENFIESKYIFDAEILS